MTEFAPQPNLSETQRIHDVELAHMGALVTEAAMRQDLAEVTADHQSRTGVSNPNDYAPNQLRIGAQVVPESDANVYRQVNESGVMDLGQSGIVRGAKTAGASSVKTNGHTTYWNRGETGKGSTLGQGFVIEAPLDTVAEGWVTADKVTGVYARDADGQVKNIVAKNSNQ